MAKDPAFLFYSGDFLNGTMFMSDEQVGKYIRLLCAQHQHGHLSKEHMMHICKSYDELVFSKFSVDEQHMYFNEKLEFEIARRKNFCKSRQNNRKGAKSSTNDTYDKTSDSTSVTHMYKHMETETITINKTEKDKEGGTGETNYGTKWIMPGEKEKAERLTPSDIGGIQEYIRITAKNELTADQINKFWEAFKIQYFTGTKTYNNGWPEVKQHFRDWLKKQPNGAHIGNSFKKVNGTKPEITTVPKGGFGKL